MVYGYSVSFIIIIIIIINENDLRWCKIKRLQGHLTVSDSVTVQTSAKFHSKKQNI